MRGIYLVAILGILAACSERGYTPTRPQALEVGKPYTVFAATTRQQDEDGSFGFGRSDRIRLLELTVSIPPEREPGQLDFGYSDPDPTTQFTMAGRHEFSSPEDFRQRLRQKTTRDDTGRREVTLFVHGYNATQAETAFRAAQLAHDFDMPGALMIYSWPSQGKALGYAYDADSMLFARDGLETVMRAIRATGADLVVVAHSMGSALAMETMRQIEISDPGWTHRNLAAVMLIAPDLDVEVFKTQTARFQKLPQPFVIFSSGRDPVLSLSGLLRGSTDRTRLGQVDSLEALSDIPVQLVDTTAYALDAYSWHLVAGTSPAFLTMMREARAVQQSFGTERLKFDTPFPASVAHSGRATKIEVAAKVN